MGTGVEAFGDAALLDAVEAEFERLEAALSRFRPQSELSRLNRDGRIAAGDDLLRVVELALAARERTGGLFDPTVHDAVVAAGYDRSFELLDTATPHAAAPVACAGDVRIRGREIALARGTKLDLGGIAKGDAVDRAVTILGDGGPALVNAGGDLACRGGFWPVGVELPGGSLTLGLEAGALATSGSDRRRWSGGHHLIDPRTGLPAESPHLRVTVAAATAVEAEVLAKAIYLGADPAGAAAILVGRDGSITRTGAFAPEPAGTPEPEVVR
jgi:thiamine biosynthesis lipoprotein